MNKQLTAIAAAAVLALLGIVALISYANNADDRALKGTEVVTALRATEQIPAKTPVSELGGKVESAKIPKSALVPGALTSLDDVKELVSTSVLVPGDQLTTAKFAAASKVKGDSAVPKGMQELSFDSSGARLVGGAVASGDRVGVFVSYGSPVGETANPINNLLVLKVSAGMAAAEGAAGTVVTVAVKTLDAEKIIHGMEFGKVWLTKQNPDTDTGGGKTINSKDVAP